MTKSGTDILVAMILIAISVFWCSYVVATIPPGTGAGDVGPRAFPLLLGILLGILALGLMLYRLAYRQSNLSDQTASPGMFDNDASSAIPQSNLKKHSRVDWLMQALTLVLIAGFGFALEKIGFVLATMLIVVLVMVLCLQDRKPLRIIAMSVGVTFVCWLIFGQILDIPLATGTWINLG